MGRKAIYKDKKTAHKAKLRYLNNYNREHCKLFSVRFNKETDADILDFLSKLENKVDFFRRVIREEIKKGS